MSLYCGNAGSAELQLGITTFAELELGVPGIDIPQKKFLIVLSFSFPSSILKNSI